MDARRRNTIEAAQASGADWALLSAPDTLAYAAGHVAGIETGPSPFDGGPTLALVGPDGEARIVCNELEAGIAAATGASVHAYESLGFADLRSLQDKYGEQVGAALKGVSGTVAIERATCPAAVADLVRERARTVAIDVELTRRRAIKTADEVDAMRRCAKVTDAGQKAARRAVTVGRSELFAWREIRLAMEEFAGTRTAVAGDFVSGRERTAAIGGPATDRRIEADDMVIADLAPRVDGYWGDSCTTLVAGEPSEDYAHMYACAYRAFEAVREHLGPGQSASDFDARIRAIIEGGGYANPVHMGHGIGTSVHEWPRLVPGNDATIEPGMVLMVEPGCYLPKIGGVRLEQMFLITRTGHEVLSGFEIAPRVPTV